MGPSKVKKQNSKEASGKDWNEKSKKKYIDKVSTEWTKNFSGRLKEFKTWVQVKGPKTLQPALSYALDWLAPELLGTGFRMFEIADFEMKAVIPSQRSNLDAQLEIHQGLVTNASFELVRTFIQRQAPDQFFRITGSELSLVKHHSWTSDLNLILKISESDVDGFFMQLQKHRRATMVFELSVELANEKTESTNNQARSIKKQSEKTQDRVDLKLHIESIELIA